MRGFKLLAAVAAVLLCADLSWGQVMPRTDRTRELISPATTDLVPVVSTTTPYKVTLSNLFKALPNTALTSPITTAYGVGAIVANKCTVVERGDGSIHQTVLTLTLTGTHDLDLADGAHGTGIKIYDLPEGRILVLGATINASVAHNGAFNPSTADTFSFAVGTAVGADDDDLTSTEVDLIPKLTLDTASGGTSPLAAAGALAASAHFDGTTTAKDVYVNVACAAANNSGATTYAVTGTLTLSWINLGDY